MRVRETPRNYIKIEGPLAWEMEMIWKTKDRERERE